MRRIVAVALTALAVLALASPAHASESRVLVAPLVFEEGGDGTGYVSFAIPVGESWSLVRWRATHYDGIDTVVVYSSATPSPSALETSDSVYSAGQVTQRKTYDTALPISSSFLNFVVSTVASTDSPTGGFVRIRVTVD